MNNNRKIFNSLLLTSYFLLLTFISGCGYTTSGANLPAEVKTINISNFTNKIDITNELATTKSYKTYYPLLEVDITKAVIERFKLNGSLRIASEDKADWLLKGELIEFRRDALRYANDEETVTEYRITIIVNLTLTDKQGNLIWQNNSFAGDTTYFTQGTQAKAESTAVADAITDLSRRIVERVIENW